MSRKRKAAHDNGQPPRSADPKLARSAFLARQQPPRQPESPATSQWPGSADSDPVVGVNHVSREEGTSAQIAGLGSSDSSDEEEFTDGYSAALEDHDDSAGLPSLSEAQYPPTWRRARELIAGEILAQKLSAVRILVTGSSGAGKATYAKYLINTLLAPPKELELTPMSAVAVLQLDPTQASYGLPGHVTLTVVESPLESVQDVLNLGHVLQESIPVGLCGQREAAKHFLAAAHELVDRLQKLHVSMPLIVCSPSLDRESDRGMDRQTLDDVVRLVQPDHVCCIASKASHVLEAFETIMDTRKSEANVWELDVLFQARSSVASAARRRSQALKDYFHRSRDNLESKMVGNVSLSQRKPYAISYRKVGDTQHQDIAGCFIFGDLPPNHAFMVSRIMDGSLVSVVVSEQSSQHNVIALGEVDQIPYFVNADGDNPDPSLLCLAKTVGLGLIRNVDHERGIMYILAPDQVAKQLENVPAKQIILVHGVADSPGWAYEDDLAAGIQPCYLGKAKKGMQTVKSRRFRKKPPS